tara:strand:- start:513 stop:659 length:147 start_codon:yes stop_codon:yes gene_type:complete
MTKLEQLKAAYDAADAAAAYYAAFDAYAAAYYFAYQAELKKTQEQTND